MLYHQTVPSGSAIKISVIDTESQIPLLYKIPCPATSGTYYISVAEMNTLGVEGPRGGSVGLVITP